MFKLNYEPIFGMSTNSSALLMNVMIGIMILLRSIIVILITAIVAFAINSALLQHSFVNLKIMTLILIVSIIVSNIRLVVYNSESFSDEMGCSGHFPFQDVLKGCHWSMVKSS